MSHLFHKLALAAVAIPALAASPAAAQTEEKAPLDVSFSLSAVSDYRFRGVSLSDKDPAFQPQMTINHESGLYLSFWGSNIADNGGDDIELDVTAGFTREVGTATLSGGAVYYVYPGTTGLNYIEVLGSIGTPVASGNVALNLAYAPSQDNIGGQDNIYASVSATHPLGDSLTLNGSFGIEDGAFGDKKRDWSFGADFDAGRGFIIGAKYIDSARNQQNPLAKATAVLSVSKSF